MRVLVLGSGVIGLTCAVRIAESGHEVAVLARDLPAETTSAVAAALWYPYRVGPQERVDGWGRAGFARFAELARTEPDSGVTMVAGNELLSAAAPDPWWSGAVPSLQRLHEFPAGYVDGWTFRAPVIEMPVYLRWLTRRLTDAGGTLTRMALGGLPDRAEVVVNAVGLAARALVGDESVSPIRGQVVHVEQFGLDRWWLDADGPTYVIPRSKDIVVGGTDTPGSWNLRPDPDAAHAILERAARLVPQLADARVLSHRVGLRPWRPRVRLEAEPLPGGGRVLHCYGHGGAGVTLSWGCADEVCSLL